MRGASFLSLCLFLPVMRSALNDFQIFAVDAKYNAIFFVDSYAPISRERAF